MTRSSFSLISLLLLKELNFDLYLTFVASLILPYLFSLAHSVLSFFKIALKMLGKIASKLVHSENESCLP